MKQLTVTKTGARLLEVNISARAEGMNPRESRKWGKIATKLLAPGQDYDDQVNALVENTQELFQKDMPVEERNKKSQENSRAIRELDETLGKEEVVIVLEEAEFSFVHDIWWTLKFPADRKTRHVINAISTALDDAIEVTAESGKIVPIAKDKKD